MNLWTWARSDTQNRKIGSAPSDLIQQRNQMDRRTFLQLLGIGGAALTVPVSSLLKEKFPDGASADEVNEFLFFRGLRPCPHSHHSSDEEFAECTGLARRAHGFYCVCPDSLICRNCSGHRRFFFNSDGLRIWRCGNCEEADIRAYLRRECPNLTTTLASWVTEA